MDRRGLGVRCEKEVENYLRQRGYRILARNYRCRVGELDLIAQDRDEVVFVEVRSRSSPSYGLPQETINYHKQERLRRAAQYYLLASGRPEAPCRFDVVGVLVDQDGQILHVEHITNAIC